MRRNASHLSHTTRWIYLTGMGSGNQRLSGCQRRLAGRNSTDCYLEWRADNRGILTEDELEIAYGYSVKVMEQMVDFWYDKDMESINMWEHGRKTDNCRNKYRIHAFAALDDGSFGTPMDRLNTEVVWSREVAPQETEIETTWTIRYQV